MKNIKIELNANEAQGEAYWRKRCDTVEAELSRLRAANEELKANVLLLQTEYLRQNPCTDPQDDIDELERKMDSLRAANAELERKINDIAGDAAKNLVDATAQDDENKRLRAVNADLVEALKKIARGVDCPEGIIKRPDFYASQDYFEHIAIDALSRAEQAAPEPHDRTIDAAMMENVRRMCEIVLGHRFGHKELDSLAFWVGHHPLVLSAASSERASECGILDAAQMPGRREKA